MSKVSSNVQSFHLQPLLETKSRHPNWKLGQGKGSALSSQEEQKTESQNPCTAVQNELHYMVEQSRTETWSYLCVYDCDFLDSQLL